MPVVIPLNSCISRPGEGDHGLIRHLEAVAHHSGDRQGNPEEKLAYLAGLAHDAAKAAEAWQDYIRKPAGVPGKGPPHAPLGAALFAVWSEHLIPRWTTNNDQIEHLRDLALDWVRMIYRHHGSLDDLDVTPPWTDPALRVEHECATLLETCDRAGLDALVRDSFPEYRGSLGNFAADLWSYEKQWRRRVEVIRNKRLQRSSRGRDRDLLGLRLAQLGGRLIYADRLHAAAWQPDEFATEQAAKAINQHKERCGRAACEARAKGASEELILARTDRQQEALERYLAARDAPLFSLLLPTGYGKTLTGLRVALEAIRAGRCKRLIYVAPYISILSQAAADIEKATGLRVFLHHHLSILQKKDDPKEDEQAEDHQAFDLMDTWQTPILATTFNQLFRALFPSRAQECIRLAALDGAFIFIDEPQIIHVEVWCVFLRVLRLTCEERQGQALFCTATLPPLEDGVGEGRPIIPLVGEVRPSICRYTISARSEPWSAAQVAEEARERLKTHECVACILNTVRDAVTVYEAVGGKEAGWRFLAAMMLPGHKQRVIEEIRKSLSGRTRTGVVCTQVLEAGVDLSFRSVMRARPIFSSVAQAAGRANRHGEGNGMAEVIVFPYVRGDEKESRGYVYRDEIANRHTDRILAGCGNILESEVSATLKDYYQACWAENPHTGSLEKFEKAARGTWTALGGLEPFGSSYPTEEIFIPGAETYLPEDYWPRMKEFGANTAEELLSVYLDRSSKCSLDFRKRKHLSTLLREFVVSYPRQAASRIASPMEESKWLWKLDDHTAYSPDTGLAHHLTSAGGDVECIIF